MDFEITWKAIYKNKALKEHSSKNKDKYTDIDRSSLEAIEVYLKDELIHTVVIDSNKRLVMRYRVTQDLFNPSKTTYVFLVGWQKTSNGKNTQEISYVYPNGVIETSGKWDSSKVLYSTPILRSEEK